MEVPIDVKEKLNKLYDRLPSEKRVKFAEELTYRLENFPYPNTVKYALLGGVLGYMLDYIPFLDDHIALGAILGGWIGSKIDAKERKKMEEMNAIILEAVKQAMA